jgi:rhamnogalacturonyl hydrolase YesR/archaellum component FlaG (FlaF/FlaG flagellin family)
METTTMTKVANKYLKDNPISVAKHIISNINGFRRDKEYRYLLYPSEHLDIPLYHYVLLKATLVRNEVGKTSFYVNPQGPVQIFINGNKVFENNLLEESEPSSGRSFSVETDLENEIIIIMKKTTMGIGTIFGGSSAKADPFFVYDNLSEKIEGWQLSFPFTKIPSEFRGKTEDLNFISWHNKNIIEQPKIRDFFSKQSGRFLYAKTNLFIKKTGDFQFLNLQETTCLFIDGEQCINRKTPLTIGNHTIVLRIIDQDECLDSFSVKDVHDRSISIFSSFDFKFPWSFLGPISQADNSIISKMFERHCVIEESSWQLTPKLVVRPYGISRLFGRWNYPLGVTLNGLFNYSQRFNDKNVFDYVCQHFKFCTDYYEWALLDKKIFGAPTIDHCLANIDSLDDCGSMAYTLLRINKVKKIVGSSKLIEDIAEYIIKIQERLPDGTLYREKSHSKLMVKTIWADDIYMSIPFLCEYYLKSKKEHVLFDIKKQLTRYFELLYMDDRQMLSHVYSLKQQRPTKVAWGRGNGWIFLSLGVALEALENTTIFPDLQNIFRKIASGYYNARGKDLFWHQVLDDQTSYQETSITLIMLFTFSKNLQHNWLDNNRFEKAELESTWKVLVEKMVDKDGNLLGVCRGSGYSFDPDYYKYKLLPRINDTHGIGILLTAGCQLMDVL